MFLYIDEKMSFIEASYVLEKFVMIFSKALSAAPAPCGAMYTDSTSAALPEGKTGPLQSVCEQSIARRQAAMPRRRSVCGNKYLFRGLGRRGMQRNIYVCVEGDGIYQNTWKLIAE